MILIPADYWLGQRTLELEYPWLTPGAIVYLESIIKPDFDILEFGCGGSTLFFARRCRGVVSFETNQKWHINVIKHIAIKNITNAKINLIQNADQIKLDEQFDLILVDNQTGYKNLSRLSATEVSIPFLKDDGFVIVDNYGYAGVDHLFKSGYSVQVFDDVHWYGNGTKVYQKC